MSAEDKYAIALGVLSIVLLAGGTVGARVLSQSSPRIVRIVWPIVGVATLAIFGSFVFIARMNAH